MSKSTNNTTKIAIIGGGIAGSSVALQLGRLGLDVTLFEKSSSLVDGPPMCHLHAGGNLYREISEAQCVTLLKESIELLQLYPHAIDYRPTVIAVPLQDQGEPEHLYPRLNTLRLEYEALIKKDPLNQVLGQPQDYFRLYERARIEALIDQDDDQTLDHLDRWMVPVAKSIDLNKVKFPLVMVQEYGLNMFRIAATVTLALNTLENVSIKCNTRVSSITKSENCWRVGYEKNTIEGNDSFDYIINAAGFQTGEIDDLLNLKRERLVEFKAAYVTRWKTALNQWPELVFYGERGTPQGMAQFTPYPGGYFQLHGMTNSITLFEDGLVKSSALSAQPKLDQKYIEKITKSWKFTDAIRRSQSAIDYLSNFIPEFISGQVASKPLYGAQQIPGEDATLRAAAVSFDSERYARCEIVKASSVLTMADAITRELIKLNLLEPYSYGNRVFYDMKKMDENKITALAEIFCKQRGYPSALAHRVVSNPNDLPS